MVSLPGVVVTMTTAIQTSPCQTGGQLRSSSYRFVDYATQLYLAVVGLLILIFHNKHINSWQLLVVGHIAAMAALHILIRMHAARPDRRILVHLRFFYPILLYSFFYAESEALNLMFVNGYLDRFFIRLEEALFGFQPSVRFMKALPFLAVSDFFYMAYFSYYIMISGVGLALYLLNKEHFFHYISIISFVFYICYLTYIFVPVIGPAVFRIPIPAFPHQASLPWYPLTYPTNITYGPFFQIMKLIYRYFEGHGAAFPSSHVIVAICTLYFSWIYLPRIRYPHLAAVIFLSLSTIYCRYHYAVDVIGGVITAALLLPLGEYLYRRIG